MIKRERERVIRISTKNDMIKEFLSNRFTTAADLYEDENINHNNQVSVDTLLREEGLGALKPQVIPLRLTKPSEQSSAYKRMFGRKKWQPILFTDESMICAEPNRIKYARRFAGEELSEEYCVKKQGFPVKSSLSCGLPSHMTVLKRYIFWTLLRIKSFIRTSLILVCHI